MIRKSIDIIAVAVLLLGMALAGHVREAKLARTIDSRRVLLQTRAYHEFVRLKQRSPICLNRL